MIYTLPWLGKYFWMNFDFSETCWKTLLYPKRSLFWNLACFAVSAIYVNLAFVHHIRFLPYRLLLSLVPWQFWSFCGGSGTQVLKLLIIGFGKFPMNNELHHQCSLHVLHYEVLTFSYTILFNMIISMSCSWHIGLFN